MRKNKIARRKGSSVVASLLFVAVLGSGSYALTAANTVTGSKAGDGTGTVTGYAVSAVKYTLDSTNPASAISVGFTLDSTPATGSTIKAQVVSGGTWFTCSNSTTTVTCPLTGGVAVTAINQLRVVAAD